MQRNNLALNGWFLLLLLVVIAGCWWMDVFVLPPLLAMNAVAFSGNRRLASAFNEELAS